MPLQHAQKQSTLSKFRASKNFIGSVVFGAAFTDGFLYGIIVPVLPYSLVTRSMVAPENVQLWNSLLLMVFGGSMIISCLILACLTGYIRSRRIALIMGLFSALAATILFIVGTNPSVLVVARCLQGLASGVIYTAGLALVAETVPHDEAGAWIGFVLSGVDIGILFAPFLAGVVYEKFGYYQVFAMALAVVLLELFLVFAMIDLPTSRGDVSTGTHNGRISGNSSPQPTESSPLISHQQPAPTGSFFFFVFLLRSPAIATAVYGCFISYVLVTAFDATLPLFVSRNFDWPSSVAGAIFLTLSLPALLGQVIGSLSDRFGPRAIALTGLIATLPGLLCVAFATSNTVAGKVIFCMALTIVGFGYNLFLIPLAADMCISVESIAGQLPSSVGLAGVFVQAYALLGCALALGTILGPFLSGLLYRTTSWAGMCGALALVVTTTAIPVTLYSHGRRDSCYMGDERDGSV